MVPRELEALYGAEESYGAKSVSGVADATGEQGVGMTSWLRLTYTGKNFRCGDSFMGDT